MSREERVETRRVPKDALVAVETNRYPVPYEWIGREITVRILESEIVLHVPEHEPVKHPKIAGRTGDLNAAPEAVTALDLPPFLPAEDGGSVEQGDPLNLRLQTDLEEHVEPGEHRLPRIRPRQRLGSTAHHPQAGRTGVPDELKCCDHGAHEVPSGPAMTWPATVPSVGGGEGTWPGNW